MTITERKTQVGMLMGDSLRQIVKKSQSIIERMSRDGVESCASADLDLLYDAIQCWKQAQAMHILNNTITSVEEHKKDETKTRTE